MDLDFSKVIGQHGAYFEAYYKQIDPKGTGAIEAMTAAKFLKKSGLSDVILSRIWDMSDPNGKGYLDKPGFFVALKLVSMGQVGEPVSMAQIYKVMDNPPKVGDLPKIVPSRMPTVPVMNMSSGDWSISVIDRLKYEQLFETLKPVGGMIAGNKVKGLLMDSKLPMDTLGKIWDLADQDKDGNLDKHEFIVAMHLVYQTLAKRTVPDVLPKELQKPKSGSATGPPPKPAPPTVAVSMPRAPSGDGFGDAGFVANFPKDIAPPPAIPPLPSIARVPPVGSSATSQPLISTDPLIPIGAPPSVTANADWVVTPAELKRYEIMFRDSDRDKDGLVSGLEVKNVFLQSGVPQNCLAHIWSLCDTNQSGKLTLEQFALAMWMVERKQKNIEPPEVLTANMVPPSMRSIISGVDLQAQEPKPTYSNPELEMISKEIEELAKERRALETEIAQKEADIRIKSGEVRSLQSELDTLSATLKQLENQRGEAQKRLDDLKAQVNKIRDQCQKQEETINEQEGELNEKRSELQKLKDEENSLQKEYEENNRELQKLTNHLQNTQLQISSVRSLVTQLLETQRQMTDALLMCRAAIENQDGELVSEYQLKIEPDFDDIRKTLEKKLEEPKADPFGDTSLTAKSNNGFNNTTNGFDSDPFTGNNKINTARGGFDESITFDSGFDAFGSSNTFGVQKDPFGADAFGTTKTTNAVTPEPGKDDFGSDPFAALHAPTGQGQVLSPNTQKSGPPPRPESPSPALPPKKSKVPPPRPAPPRPNQGPARPAQPAMDAFGSPASGAGGSGGFADFADFDNKLLSSIPSTQSTSTLTLSTLYDTTHLTTANKKALSTSLSSLTTTLADAVNISNSFSTNANSTTRNHLTRSLTPMQQAASAFSSSHSNKDVKAAAIIKGPTDFADDPFKDYRYEDPFNIKDPFADDDFADDPEKIFKDDIMSSDDDEKNKNSITATANVQKPTTALDKNLINQFDAFGLSSTKSELKTKSTSNTPQPVANEVNFADFDAFSTVSSSNTEVIKNMNNKNNNVASNDSFFNAFNDNFETNSNCDKNFTGIFDVFNDNDKKMNAFGDSNSTKDAFAYSTTATDRKINAFNDSASTMDAFADNAATIDAFSAFTIKKKQNNEFDAFSMNAKSDSSVSKSLKFVAFTDNGFEDNFGKQQNTNSNNINNNNFINNSMQDKKLFNDNFAKFDAFNTSADFNSDYSPPLNNSIQSNSSSASSSTAAEKVQNKVQNKANLNKIANNLVATDNAAKVAEKFAEDYSKPDKFADDLEEAIKRSMQDQ